LFHVPRIFALILSLFTPPYLAGITAVPNEAFYPYSIPYVSNFHPHLPAHQTQQEQIARLLQFGFFTLEYLLGSLQVRIRAAHPRHPINVFQLAIYMLKAIFVLYFCTGAFMGAI